MKHNRLNACRRMASLAVLAVCLVAQTHAATVTFQGKQYAVGIVPLGTGVPNSAGCDLVFVALTSGGNVTKYLAIPSNSGDRGCFDPNAQYFLRVDRTNGLINAFTSINSTFINLDGTFNSVKQDSPALVNNASPLASYVLPTATINTQFPADIQILYDPNFTDGHIIGYRDSETTVFELDRSTNNAVVVNKDPVSNYVATGAVAFEFDTENQTLLFVQPTLQDGSGNALSGRLSAYTRGNPSLLFDQIILDNNPAIPGYKGTASGIAYDVTNGNIYILDSTQLIVFTRVTPTLFSITPTKGTVAGGTNLTLAGEAFPSDATVTIDGTSVSSTVVSPTVITCTTLAHAPGAVAVLINSASFTTPLSGTYTYVDTPPVCTLTAPATVGTLPFTVDFETTSSSADSSIASRILDFGDGNQYTFPSDFTVTGVSHTYTVNGTYQAVLTVADNYGETATASLRIISGTGGSDVTGVLILKSFKLDLANNGGSPPADSVAMQGQVSLPSGLTPNDFSVGALTLTLQGPTSPGVMHAIESIPLRQKHAMFTMKAAKGIQYAAGTYLFTLSLAAVDLQNAFDYNVESKAGTIVNGRAQLAVTLDFQTAQGRNFFFKKTGANDVVVDIKMSKKNLAISLLRP